MQCPECGSRRLYKAGVRQLSDSRSIQRWLCRDCGYRFSVGQVQNNSNKNVKQSINHQLSVILREAKKLDSATEIKTVAGESQKDIKGKLVWFIWEMQKQNYSKDTITTYSRCIKNLMKRKANLTDPESIKEALARWKCGESHKHNIAAAYTLFLKMQGQTWNPPMFHVNRKLPFIPTEKELDALIAGTGRKTSVFLQTLKETAMRSGECSRLKWENVDLQRRTIILNEAEKNGNPRIFNISSTLEVMLTRLKKKTEYVFGSPSKTARSSAFYNERKRIAYKLGNPKLLKIGLHTFRHWKATMLYHETRDIVVVKEFLGHKTLDVTLLYIQIEKALFRNEAENFTVKATKEPEEIQALLEVGFEYICQKDDVMYFRKRK